MTFLDSVKHEHMINVIKKELEKIYSLILLSWSSISLFAFVFDLSGKKRKFSQRSRKCDSAGEAPQQIFTMAARTQEIFCTLEILFSYLYSFFINQKILAKEAMNDSSKCVCL